MARFHSRLTTALVALFLAAGSTEAQDNDTVIQSRDRRPLSVVDQIADPAERNVLLTLYGADDARERLRLATAFVANYPRSWLLAQAYEIAAKASIDLGDYDRALDYGRQSLKIFPENPLLLVPLANVYAQRALIAEAKQSARDALECLKQFGRPAAIPEPAWPDLERQLKASSYFVLGRATASEALALAPRFS
jgi:tetratricopeptide (TPR) repeat protein